MKTLICVFSIAALALPAFSRINNHCVLPPNAEAMFPTQPGKISESEQIRLKLRLDILPKPQVMFNHHRELGENCFLLEQIPAGTKTWFDRLGKPRYKEGCGNLLIEVGTSCTACHKFSPHLDLEARTPLAQGIGLIGGTPRPASGGNFAGDPEKKVGAWSRFWDNAEKSWGNTWAGLGSLSGALIPLLAILASLGLLGYLIYRAIQNRQQQAQGGQNLQAVQPLAGQANAGAPPQAQAAVPVVPVPPPPPVQAAAVANPAQPQPGGGQGGAAPQPIGPNDFTFMAGGGNRPHLFRMGDNITQVHSVQLNGGGREIRFIIP